MGAFKLCPLLSTKPAEICLIVVLMLYRVIRFEYRPSIFRPSIFEKCSRRSTENIPQVFAGGIQRPCRVTLAGDFAEFLDVKHGQQE